MIDEEWIGGGCVECAAVNDGLSAGLFTDVYSMEEEDYHLSRNRW